MAWDPDKPAGSQKLRLSDDDLRANFAALEVVFGTLIDGATAITSSAAELNILDGKAFLDEDNMASNSATGIPSQQSVKAYADAKRPAGEMTFWAGSSGAVPSGWLLCNGQAVSRTTYASLFSAISTGFGVGDGSTTFNVPDLRDRLPIGVGSTIAATLAATGGAATKDLSHTHTGPSHTHTFSGTTQQNTDQQLNVGEAGTPSTKLVHTHPFSGTTASGGSGNTGSSGSSTQDIMNPYIGLHYIIRT